MHRAARHTSTPPLPSSTPPLATPAAPHSQVKYILGLKLPRSDTLQDALSDIFSNLGQFKWREFCMVSFPSSD